MDTIEKGRHQKKTREQTLMEREDKQLADEAEKKADAETK